MSQKKLNQAFVLKRLVDDRQFTIAQAAEALGLSERHVKRLKGEFRKYGADALVHKNIGRLPAHAVPEDIRKRVIELKSSKLFEKANFSHFKEVLGREQFGINICYSSLHGILTSAGIKSPKTRRPAKKHRRRKRKEREGIMLQMDASPFDWLNNGTNYSIHGAIDDATGKVLGLYMCKNECLQGYFEVMRSVITKYGIPLSLYADRHAIFVPQKEGKLTVEDQIKGVMIKDTQFGRAIRQLGITLIQARTAEAKGRIERLWETLQSRLPIEFALANVTTVDAANAFLVKYTDEFNHQFAEEAQDATTAYRELSPALNLDNILCNMEKRVFDKGGVFSFYNRTFKIISDKPDRILPYKGNIDVLVSPVFGIRVCFAGIIYEVIPFIQPERAEKMGNETSTIRRAKCIPANSHYYKYGHKLVKKVTYEDNDVAILKVLERVFLCEMPAS